MAGELPAKIEMVRSAILRNRTDGALVRVSTPVSGGVAETTAQLVVRYVQALYPVLGEYLPELMGQEDKECRVMRRAATAFRMIVLVRSAVRQIARGEEGPLSRAGRPLLQAGTVPGSDHRIPQRPPHRPESPGRSRQIGLAHYQLGQLGLAFRFLLAAQELEPDNPRSG